MNDLDMVMAVSALQGYAAAKNVGADIKQLVSSLKLGQEEWKFIKEHYDHIVNLLTPAQQATIEQYFEEHEV